jgi:PAS domain S-box-containing protein
MSNELDRINAVNRFKQLNAAITTDLNEIVNLAAQLCNTPVALITLLDEDTQWFKASKGVDLDCTDRRLAFCNHTILQDGLMIVPDTSIDERFTDNALVYAAPHVRFYAGATLKTNDGHAIGSLCVVDLEARELNEQQQYSLKVLSKQVMNLMELNWSLQVLEQQHKDTQAQKKIIEESEIKLNAIFNSSKDTHVLVNKDLEILAFNNAAAEFTAQEYGKILSTGVSILDYTDPESVESLTRHLETAFSGQSVKREWNMRPGTASELWKELEFVPIKNKANEIIGVALNSTDITERKLQEDQINIQNAALTRIAIIQSHELRRPVASLLGIMALIKLEQTKTDTDYFDILEITVKELDEKIREIVKDSENTINNHMAIVA